MTIKEEIETLAQGIMGSYEARTQAVAHLREATQGEIRELGEGRQAMTRQLRSGLAKGRTDLAADVVAQIQQLNRTHRAMARQLRSNLAQYRSDLKVGVSTELTALGKAHQAMTRQLRSGLAKGRADRARAEARRSAEVNAWIKEVATAHAGARQAWQDLTATMHAKRNGGVAVAEREAVGEEIVSRSKRLFEYLAQHPDGTRLAELQEQFGMKRFEATRTVRRLMDEGKVEKRDLLYFAV